MASCYWDPLRYVLLAFPWGEGPLAGETGPDVWQAEALILIGEKLRNAKRSVRIAVRSGHGVGKTTLAAWLTLWWQSTRVENQQVTTASTKVQLGSKTWRELAKWQRLALNGYWFQWTATRFFMKTYPETWYASAIPWSKHRSDAFAGTHEKDVFMLFDEASAIDDLIWEVAEGAMTTAGSLWVVQGNPTRNTGRFHGCFHRERHRWTGIQVDARRAKQTNKAEIEEWIMNYGEDSDFCRVRVKGEFPRASSTQFIGTDVVDKAIVRSYHSSQYNWSPVVFGVDVARFGDDQSVIYVRQGLATLEIRKFREVDTMRLSSMVAELANHYRPQLIFVDGIGIGAGVVDRLRQLRYINVVDVNVGIKEPTTSKYNNMRAKIWGKMRDWLVAGGSIPEDTELRDDLTGIEYGYDEIERLQLEKKEDMKRRGLASPDAGDALALTFSQDIDIQNADVRADRGMQQADTAYDVFGYNH